MYFAACVCVEFGMVEELFEIWICECAFRIKRTEIQRNNPIARISSHLLRGKREVKGHLMGPQYICKFILQAKHAIVRSDLEDPRRRSTIA